MQDTPITMEDFQRAKKIVGGVWETFGYGDLPDNGEISGAATTDAIKDALNTVLDLMERYDGSWES